MQPEALQSLFWSRMNNNTLSRLIALLWNDRDQYYFFISWQQLIYNSFLGYYLYLNVEFDFLDNEKNASVKTAIFLILSVFIYHKV